MPWDIKKNDKGEYCLHKKDDGSMVKGSCHSSRSETAKMMAAMYASEEGMMNGKKMMENVQLALSMKNPVWLGCAVTNRPHIRLKEHPLSVVDINGKKFIRVPMMKAGKYRHPQGDLDMTGDVLNQFIDNHNKGLADFEVVLDAKHQPDRGALGLFESKQGAFVQREKAGTPQVSDPNGELLVAYAIPTGDDAIETIESGKFRHASMEFHPDYSSNVEQTYLSSDLREIDMTVQLGGPGSGRKGHTTARRRLPGKGGFRSSLGKMSKKLKPLAKSFNKKANKFAKATTKAYANKAKKHKQFYGHIGTGFKRAGKLVAKEYGLLENSLETIQLDTFIPMYETLVEYIEESPDTDFVWFDADIYDFSGTDLSNEDGYYKVDKQMAEEMLAALDELAQDEEYQHLFEESEEDMSDEVEVDETVQELQVQLEAAQASIIALQKSNLESSVRALISDLRNLKEDGYSFTAVTLNLAEALMLGNPIGEGDNTIKLEDATNPGEIATYFRKGMVEFLKSALVRAKTEGATIPAQQIQLERVENGNGLYDKGKADAPSFWSQRF